MWETLPCGLGAERHETGRAAFGIWLCQHHKRAPVSFTMFICVCVAVRSQPSSVMPSPTSAAIVKHGNRYGLSQGQDHKQLFPS